MELRLFEFIQNSTKDVASIAQCLSCGEDICSEVIWDIQKKDSECLCEILCNDDHQSLCTLGLSIA
eukprot:scaffold163188_cov13-Prasinocladus_malaysianus.AAC.1